MIQFRFPHAVAFYCGKLGFQHAVKMAKQFAIIPTTEFARTSAFDMAASAYVDTCMKARIAEFQAQQLHG